MCQQKDDMINKLQAAMDSTVEDATRDVNTLYSNCLIIHIFIFFTLCVFGLLKVQTCFPLDC